MITVLTINHPAGSLASRKLEADAAYAEHSNNQARAVAAPVADAAYAEHSKNEARAPTVPVSDAAYVENAKNAVE